VAHIIISEKSKKGGKLEGERVRRKKIGMLTPSGLLCDPGSDTGAQGRRRRKTAVSSNSTPKSHRPNILCVIAGGLGSGAWGLTKQEGL